MCGDKKTWLTSKEDCLVLGYACDTLVTFASSTLSLAYFQSNVFGPWTLDVDTTYHVMSQCE